MSWLRAITKPRVPQSAPPTVPLKPETDRGTGRLARRPGFSVFRFRHGGKGGYCRMGRWSWCSDSTEQRSSALRKPSLAAVSLRSGSAGLFSVLLGSGSLVVLARVRFCSLCSLDRWGKSGSEAWAGPAAGTFGKPWAASPAFAEASGDN
ncbi:hypothetical protein ANANG_G00209980, partial [Anguilla anguilla]